MIMSVILLTTLFYKVLMLEGEIWRSSLLVNSVVHMTIPCEVVTRMGSHIFRSLGVGKFR